MGYLAAIILGIFAMVDRNRGNITSADVELVGCWICWLQAWYAPTTSQERVR